MKLAQYLARSGLGSRRKMEGLVKSGRVTLDGVVCTDQSREVGEGVVRVDGSVIKPADLVYFAWHKPRGVTTTFSDTHATRTLNEALPAEIRRYPVFAVGRLDRETEGLLLLTTDGAWAESLIHPRNASEKVYRALIEGDIPATVLTLLQSGVQLDDGFVKPISVRRAGRESGGVWLEITLTEGRNRIVRRMIDALGLRLLRLIRIRIGDISLNSLKVDEYRRLEVAK